MNETTLTIRGNLVAPPERITSAKGDFTTFRVAVNEFHRDQATGGYVDGRSSFYKVVAFRQLGTNVHKSLSKGDAVVVHGTLRINQWETASGDTRSAPEIEARSVGPDLRFGIATYQRVPSQRQAGDQQPSWRQAGAGGQPDPWAAHVAAGPAGPEAAFGHPGEDEDPPMASTGPLVEAG